MVVAFAVSVVVSHRGHCRRDPTAAAPLLPCRGVLVSSPADVRISDRSAACSGLSFRSRSRMSLPRPSVKLAAPPHGSLCVVPGEFSFGRHPLRPARVQCPGFRPSTATSVVARAVAGPCRRRDAVRLAWFGGLLHPERLATLRHAAARAPRRRATRYATPSCFLISLPPLSRAATSLADGSPRPCCSTALPRAHAFRPAARVAASEEEGDDDDEQPKKWASMCRCSGRRAVGGNLGARPGPCLWRRRRLAPALIAGRPWMGAATLRPDRPPGG